MTRRVGSGERKVPLRAVNGKERKLTRRRHQEGMLLELKNGWAVRYYENCDGERRRMQKWLGDFKELPTRSAARTAMQGELAIVNQTVTFAPRITSITFRSQAKKWITDCEARSTPIKPSVAHNWRCILTNHLNPMIGEQPLADVQSLALKDVVKRLGAKKLAPATIRNICQVVKLVVASAVDDEGNFLFPVKWNRKFIAMPKVNKRRQRRPSFTPEQVTSIVTASTGRLQMACVLFAATGLRAGELLGLEVRHFDGSSVDVEQSVWGGNNKVGLPKTENAERTVDLHPDVSALLRQFIGTRTTGFIFQTSSRTPVTQTNLLRRELHPLLTKLGIPLCGFHAFRRFRNTHLRQTRCPDSVLKFWMGHADEDMSDHYDFSCEDLQYRRDVAKAMGLGFEVPKSLIANPSKAKVKTSQSGLIGRFAETKETEAIPC